MIQIQALDGDGAARGACHYQEDGPVPRAAEITLIHIQKPFQLVFSEPRLGS